MKGQTWKQASQQLKEDTGTASAKQRKVAAFAGISIGKRTPRLVAAAQLRILLKDELDLPDHGGVQDHAHPVIARLWRDAGTPPTPQTKEEADAWIEHLFLLRRRAALIKLRPEPGDIVVTENGGHAELSSIGIHGRLYFTGGNGRSAWPDNVTIVARAADKSTSAKDARRKAENAASISGRAVEWTFARDHDLRDFRVMGVPSESDLLRLEEVIESAKDERPVQKLLQEIPALLTLLVPGNDCFLIPQKRLGNQYVPDFLIGFVDSAGMHWHLVELESPRAPMFTQDGKAFANVTRKGINQIVDWREWLDGNVAYARKLQSDNGLGLYGIRNDAPGLVLVGRRATLTNKNHALRNHMNTSHIAIHTYDWLVHTLRGSFDYSGPPAGNPFAIGRNRRIETFLD